MKNKPVKSELILSIAVPAVTVAIVFLLCGIFPKQKDVTVFAAEKNAYCKADEIVNTEDFPVVYDGCFFVSAKTASEAFGAEILNENEAVSVKLGGKMYEAPASGDGEHSRLIDGKLYVKLSDFCARLELYCEIRGGMAFVSGKRIDMEKIDTKRYASLLEYGSFRDLSFDAEHSYIVNPYVMYSYEQMNADIASLEKMYPELITSYSIGFTAEGKSITAFSFGKGGREIILCASTHASEYLTTNFVMYMVDRYACAYANDESFGSMSYRQLLDNVKFIVVPMLNADGVNIAQNGFDASTNAEAVKEMPLRCKTYGGWRANSNGVDLNRNYPYNWCESSTVTVPTSAEYRGPYAGSEPETQTMMKLLENSPFEMLASFHTYGEIIYWADSMTPELTEKYKDVANRFIKAFGYRDAGVENISSFGGFFCNWARGTYKKFCMTVELCPMASMPEYMFDEAGQKAYSVGLIMADETLKTNAETAAVKVTVNGRNAVFPSIRPFEEGGVLYIPYDSVFGLCGIRASFDEKGGVYILSDMKNEMTFKTASAKTRFNKCAYRPQSKFLLVDGVLCVPAREILEAFGAYYEWNAEENELTVEMVR